MIKRRPLFQSGNNRKKVIFRDRERTTAMTPELLQKRRHCYANPSFVLFSLPPSLPLSLSLSFSRRTPLEFFTLLARWCAPPAAGGWETGETGLFASTPLEFFGRWCTPPDAGSWGTDETGLFTFTPLKFFTHSQSAVHTTGWRRLKNRWNWTFLHPLRSSKLFTLLACCWCAPPTGCRRLNNRWNLDFCPRPCGPYMT